MSSRTSLPLVLALTLFVLATAVGAAAQPGRSAQADLTTSKGIAAYLRSKGIDPAGFVVQRGAHNYAGPNCPGRGWSCTKGKKVVQVSSRHGHNVAECGPGGTLTTAPNAITCVVVQNSTYGRNEARCGLKNRDTTPMVLDCRIEQTNTKGDNVARIKQQSDQDEGADQRATLNALVRQTTSGGDNRSDVKQLIDQSTHDVAMATPGQNQEGRFTAQVTQTSETGVNVSNLVQRLDQSGKARSDSSVAQRQFSDQLGNVDQTNGAAEPTTQSTSRSKWKHKRKSFSISRADQFETQRLRGPGPQTQIGPQFCCSTQTRRRLGSDRRPHPAGVPADGVPGRRRADVGQHRRVHDGRGLRRPSAPAGRRGLDQGPPDLLGQRGRALHAPRRDDLRDAGRRLVQALLAQAQAQAEGLRHQLGNPVGHEAPTLS